MDYSRYRESALEQERINDLLRIIPMGFSNVLDIGARDGYISKALTEYFEEVTAVDIEVPTWVYEKVTTKRGDVCHLHFPDSSFDVVLCAEVLEHIHPLQLGKACNEVSRVAKHYVVIGVPYRQDIRSGRATCPVCKGKNPPWGHLNSFDENKLNSCFSNLTLEKSSYIGSEKDRTNFLSVLLMDLGGNPWGTYGQEETCVYCGSKLVRPTNRKHYQRLCSKIAYQMNRIQTRFLPPRANWIHLVLRKT